MGTCACPPGVIDHACPEHGIYRPIPKPKPPEFTHVNGRTRVKVYLCPTCAANLRAIRLRQAGVLDFINLDVLCKSCRGEIGPRVT